MKFEYVDYNKNISNNLLIDDVKKVANKLNSKSLSIKEYDLYGLYDSSTIIRRFHSWNNAMKICGLDGKNKFYNEIDLFSNLYNVWTKKGKQPSRRDMDDKNISEISSGAYLRKFNKWQLALKAFINFINEDESISHPSHLNVEFKHKTARDINLRLRFKVFQRDNFKCKICGASPAIDSSVILQVDHIIPYSKGGETILENLQTLCQKCNLGKSNL